MNSLRDKIILASTLLIIIMTIFISAIIVKKIEIRNLNNNNKNFFDITNEIKSSIIFEEKISTDVINIIDNVIKSNPYLCEVSILSDIENYNSKKEDRSIKKFDCIYTILTKDISTTDRVYTIKTEYKNILHNELNPIIFINICIYLLLTITIIIIMILNKNIKAQTSIVVENKKSSNEEEIIEINFSHNKNGEELIDNINHASTLDQNSVIIFFDFTKIAAEQYIVAKQFLTKFSENVYLLSGAISNNDNIIKATIPEISITDAYQIAEKFIKTIKEDNNEFCIPCGITSKNGRTISALSLLDEAEKALIKSKLDNNEIICFNANKEKYEEYLASKC